MTMITSSPLYRQQAYINGQWVDADNHHVFEVTNPATGEVIANISDVGTAKLSGLFKRQNKRYRHGKP